MDVEVHNITIKLVGLMVSWNREYIPKEEKEIVLKAYQERSSMRGIERTFGVCRQTLSAWLKKGGTAAGSG